MTLSRSRQAIRGLLAESNPSDAQAYYYAYLHPDQKVRLHIHPPQRATAEGYICLARTGMDLFRPYMTLRLPQVEGTGEIDLEASGKLVFSTLDPESAVIAGGPVQYLALLEALFEFQSISILRLYILDHSRFEPIINVLISRSESFNGLPRFAIRKGSSNDGEVMAASGLNWQSSRFAEIYTNTSASYRRQGYGKSVVSATVQYLLDIKRTPLYMVNEENEPSIKLAESAGFVDTGIRKFQLEGYLRKKPD